ncbi:MAG: rod shape-determining protein MreD [Prevotella sp.]|nr:rod shape-determining protein MreD [Prevotella sp.]
MEHVERLVLFVVLLVVQVLILSHICLFQVAMPLLYVFFAITFRRGTPKWMILLWSFAMGLMIDMFSNTPGLATGCLTLIGFLQPYLLEPLVPRDSADNMKVSAATLGVGKFATLCTVLVALYCLLFFALESFTFFNWQLWLLRAGGSALITLVIIFAVESIRSR